VGRAIVVEARVSVSRSYSDAASLSRSGPLDVRCAASTYDSCLGETILPKRNYMDARWRLGVFSLGPELAGTMLMSYLRYRVTHNILKQRSDAVEARDQALNETKLPTAPTENGGMLPKEV